MATHPAKNRKQILNKFDDLPKDVQDYFKPLREIIEDFPLDIAISHMFSRVERAHTMTLYCGATKCHRVNKDLALKAVSGVYMTREKFGKLYKEIFGKELSPKVAGKIEDAKQVRDNILHGKPNAIVHERLERKAICDILEYAEAFNEEVNVVAEFKPFGSLRGFKGRAKAHSPETSRLILRGIGFEKIS